MTLQGDATQIDPLPAIPYTEGEGLAPLDWFAI